jgi:hypothetical protein
MKSCAHNFTQSESRPDETALMGPEAVLEAAFARRLIIFKYLRACFWIMIHARMALSVSAILTGRTCRRAGLCSSVASTMLTCTDRIMHAGWTLPHEGHEDVLRDECRVYRNIFRVARLSTTADQVVPRLFVHDIVGTCEQ